MSYDFAVTRTVRDAAHLLDAVHGPNVGDKYATAPPARHYTDELRVTPGPLRVAFMTRAWSGTPVDAEVADTVIRVGEVLEQAGHVLSESAPALNWESVIQAISLEFTEVAAPFLLAPRQPDPRQMEADLTPNPRRRSNPAPHCT